MESLMKKDKKSSIYLQTFQMNLAQLPFTVLLLFLGGYVGLVLDWAQDTLVGGNPNNVALRQSVFTQKAMVMVVDDWTRRVSDIYSDDIERFQGNKNTLAIKKTFPKSTACDDCEFWKKNAQNNSGQSNTLLMSWADALLVEKECEE